MSKLSLRNILLLTVFISGVGKAQVGESEKSYIRVGELQTHISAYGSERAWNEVYYEGLKLAGGLSVYR